MHRSYPAYVIDPLKPPIMLLTVRGSIRAVYYRVYFALPGESRPLESLIHFLIESVYCRV